jgi:ATP-binding cassette subfamily B protein
VDADLIVVLNRGRIFEAGSHKELLARNGRYAAMLASQLANHHHDLNGSAPVWA